MHNCTARYFAYSIAYVNTSTRKITINRSQCHDSISMILGGRRYSFVLTGEMALVSNTLTRYGRHSYVINWTQTPGPNVFVDGIATGAYSESGSHGDWNNGGLWDNITDNKLQVKLERQSANCVAWNCVLNSITFENMALSPNWSLGSTKPGGGAPAWINSVSGYAQPYLGKAEVWSNGTKMPVRSLYAKQVETRLSAAGNAYRYQANLPTRITFPPVIRTPDQLVALSGSAFFYQIPVSNIVAATTSPNYQVTGLPVGVTRNAATGLISGTLPTVSVETNYTLSISARNVDGTTTKAMTLTVRPAGSPKIPLTLALEVDMDRTTPLLLGGTTSTVAIPVPLVPASRLLAPMIVRKSYTSDMNGTAYTAADVPVPVSAVVSLEGLTSPVNVTYNGSTTLPTAPGFYDIVATLDDPIYSASATSRLLITSASAVTVNLANTTAPTAFSPVTATSSQPSLTPIMTYDGAAGFPTVDGFYTVKAVVADPTYFGSRIALVNLIKPSATLVWGSLTLPFNGAAQKPTVTTIPSGLATQVSIIGPGVFPGSYQVTASITDPNFNSTPLAGTLVIADDNNGTAQSAVVNWMFGGPPGGTATPGTNLIYSRRTGAQLRSLLPDALLYPDTDDYHAFTVRVRRNLQGAEILPQASANLVFGPASTQTALLVETVVLDADCEQRTYAVVPLGGGPAAPRAFLRFILNY